MSKKKLILKCLKKKVKYRTENKLEIMSFENLVSPSASNSETDDTCYLINVYFDVAGLDETLKIVKVERAGARFPVYACEFIDYNEIWDLSELNENNERLEDEGGECVVDFDAIENDLNVLREYNEDAFGEGEETPPPYTP